MRPHLTLRSRPGTTAVAGREVALVALLLGIGLLEAALAVGGERPAALVVVPLLAVPLIRRRQSPTTVAQLVTAALAVQLPWTGLRLFDQTFTGFVCIALACYSLGRHAPRRGAMLVASGCAAAAALVIGVEDRSIGSAVLAGALVLAPVFLGYAVRTRASLLEALDAQSSELESARRTAARAGALAARGRLAGEVQALVRRSVEEMVEGAAQARRYLATHSTGTIEAIARVEETGRVALEEMRRLLGVLRTGEVSAPDALREAPIGRLPLTEAGPARHERWRTVDPALALVVVAAAESATLAGSGLEAVAAGLVGATVAAPVRLRSRRPLHATLLTWAAAVAMSIFLDPPFFALTLLVPLLAYAAGAHATTIVALTALLSSWVGILAFNTSAGTVSWGDHVFPAVLVTLAWAAGRLARQQRLLAAEVLERNRELEGARQLESTVAAADERLRIARELHDVVAHSLMVMVVQAGAARRSLESGRPGSDEALRVVEETGRASATELSRLFDLVDPAGRPDQSPGMDHLDELVERTRAAGLAVEVTTEGSPSSLPAGVDLAAYRIVQESLTNVLRHAHATRVQVRVRYQPDAVHVEVSDDGIALPGSTTPSPGHGINGMRERARDYSGTVATGPRSGGGFLVQAMIPLHPARQEEHV